MHSKIFTLKRYEWHLYPQYYAHLYIQIMPHMFLSVIPNIVQFESRSMIL